mgnify:CR=1 FL=1
MKKFLFIFLILILVFGAGVGGYFIGNSQKTNETATITNKDVVEILDKFCYSAGWTNTTNTNSVKASSNEEIYDKDYMDYNGQEDFIKSWIYLSKYTLLHPDVMTGQYYISNATYRYNDYQYTGTMGLYYEFGNNCAYINIHDFNSQTTVTIIVDIAPVEKDTYQINIILDKSIVGFEQKEGVTLQQLNMDQYINEIYSFSMFTMETDEKNLSNIAIEDVSEMRLYGCDLRTHKQIDIYKTSIINEQTYTFDALLGKLKEQTSRTQGVAFGSREYKEIDVLEEVYRNLGYEII